MSQILNQPYDSIGSNSTAGVITQATLTASLSGNTSNGRYKKFMSNFHIEGIYTPQTTNAFCVLLIEYSNEDFKGGPVNWFPLDVVTPTAVEQDLYDSAATAMGMTSGVPLIIPGNKTTTIAQNYKFSYDNSSDAIWIRVSALETMAGGGAPATFGALYANLTVGD